MESDNTTPSSDATLFAGEAWFDPIAAGLRGRVRKCIEDLIEQEHAVALGRGRYLSALRSAMPPRPFDLHVKRAAEGSPLVGLIHARKVDTHADDTAWWVGLDQVSAFMPNGECVDDPASAWFVGPDDRADHGEVDRLTAEHRRYWPEIYGDIAPASMRAASLQTG
jgi:hypothetical protein